MGILKDLFKPSYEPYRRNPAGISLTRSQQQAIAVGAILTESNCEFIDSLQPGTAKEMKQRKQHQILDEWWEIASPQEAVDGLESLKNRGHRRIFSAILANIPQAMGLEPTFEDFERAFNEAGLPIAGEEITKEYPKELELTKKHIAVFHDMADKDFTNKEFDLLMEKHAPMFGGEEALYTCLDIYGAMLDRYEQYSDYADNLSQNFEKLQKRGFVADVPELATINPAAWDFGRLVNVARWCLACGYINEDTAWKYIMHAKDEAARIYANWTDFARAYITGRAIWGGDSVALDDMMDIADGLLKDETSPWRLVALK